MELVSHGTYWLVTALLAIVLVTVAVSDGQLEVDKKARPFLGKRHTGTGSESSDRSESLEFDTDEEERKSSVDEDLISEEQYKTAEQVPSSFSSENQQLTSFESFDKRVRPFLGKRSTGDKVVSRGKRARPFLGKRPRPFLGKRAGQSQGQSEEEALTEELAVRLLRLHPELLHRLHEDKRARPFLG